MINGSNNDETQNRQNAFFGQAQGKNDLPVLKVQKVDRRTALNAVTSYISRG